MASIIYSPKDIFDQEFKISMRGFDRAEVDEFLDNVINDYELFLAEIESLKSENLRLKAEVRDLKDQISEHEKQVLQAPQVEQPTPLVRTMTPNYASLQPSQVQGSYQEDKGGEVMSTDPFATEPRLSVAATNFDILKRISRLEKEVFGKKIVE